MYDVALSLNDFGFERHEKGKYHVEHISCFY